MRGWVVTVNGKVGRLFRQHRALIWTSCGTLFPSYEAARNAKRMSERTDKREMPAAAPRQHAIYRVEAAP